MRIMNIHTGRFTNEQARAIINHILELNHNIRKSAGLEIGENDALLITSCMLNQRLQVVDDIPI